MAQARTSAGAVRATSPDARGGLFYGSAGFAHLTGAPAGWAARRSWHCAACRPTTAAATPGSESHNKLQPLSVIGAQKLPSTP